MVHRNPARPGTTTVFTLPGCVACEQTKNWLRDHGVVYRVVRVDQDPAAREELRAIGYRTAPVIRTADGVEWSGFSPSLLAALLPDTTTATADTTGAAGQATRAAGRRDVTAAGRRAVTAVG